MKKKEITQMPRSFSKVKTGIKKRRIRPKIKEMNRYSFFVRTSDGTRQINITSHTSGEAIKRVNAMLRPTESIRYFTAWEF